MVFGFGKKKIQDSTSVQRKERIVSLEDIPIIIQEIELPHITEIVMTANSVREAVEKNKQKAAASDLCRK